MRFSQQENREHAPAVQMELKLLFAFADGRCHNTQTHNYYSIKILVTWHNQTGVKPLRKLSLSMHSIHESRFLLHKTCLFVFYILTNVAKMPFIFVYWTNYIVYGINWHFLRVFCPKVLNKLIEAVNVFLRFWLLCIPLKCVRQVCIGTCRLKRAWCDWLTCAEKESLYCPTTHHEIDPLLKLNRVVWSWAHFYAWMHVTATNAENQKTKHSNTNTSPRSIVLWLKENIDLIDCHVAPCQYPVLSASTELEKVMQITYIYTICPIWLMMSRNNSLVNC